MDAELSLKACPFCRCPEYIRLKTSINLPVVPLPDQRTLRKKAAYPTIEMFICRDCGRTEFFVDDPDKVYRDAVDDPSLDADFVEVESTHPYRSRG